MTAEPPTDATDQEQPHRFLVSESDEGKRLDAFLSGQFFDASRVRIQGGIAAGLAKVDGQPRKSSYKLRATQKVEFQLPPAPAEGPQAESIPLEILYEDEVLAVVNKPPGMVVHPAKGHWSGTLASALVHHFENLSQYGGAHAAGHCPSTRPAIPAA